MNHKSDYFPKRYKRMLKKGWSMYASEDNMNKFVEYCNEQGTQTTVDFYNGWYTVRPYSAKTRQSSIYKEPGALVG